MFVMKYRKCLSVILFAVLTYSLSSISQATLNNNNLNALWMMESGDLQKLTTVDVHNLCQLPYARDNDICVIARNTESDFIWMANNIALHTHAFIGVLRTSFIRSTDIASHKTAIRID